MLWSIDTNFCPHIYSGNWRAVVLHNLNNFAVNLCCPYGGCARLYRALNPKFRRLRRLLVNFRESAFPR